MSEGRTLNTQQKVFLEQYLKCWNATEAARFAGYSHPNKQGPRLLVNVGISTAIRERLNELQMGSDEVLTRLTSQARSSIEDFGEVDRYGTFHMDLSKAARLGQLANIKKLKPTKYGYELELYDSQAALDKLGRAHGLWKEGWASPSVNVNVNAGPPHITEVVVHLQQREDNSDEGAIRATGDGAAPELSPRAGEGLAE